MLEKLLPPVERDRPYPWRCVECKSKEVYPQATDYTTQVKHDGRLYTVRVPDLQLPTCRKCGAQSFAVRDDIPIFDALRAQLGLLAPEFMRRRRVELGLSEQEMADQLGVAEETVSRWETGALIPSRAMDNLLRLFFESEENRRLLRRGFGDKRAAGADTVAMDRVH